MSSRGATLSLMLLLLVLAVLIHFNDANPIHEASWSEISEKMEPLMEPVKMVDRMMVFNENRRKLSSFQICAPCTCCGGANRVCLPSPCCYAINCNIPNRPFGFCSFTPKTCNCFGCQI